LKKMRVQLLSFGVLKDAAIPGWLELPAGATVEELLSEIALRVGGNTTAVALLPRIAVSVNAEYAIRDLVLSEGDMVGLLPPVSGGSGDVFSSALVSYLTRDVIPSDELVRAAKQGGDGAVVVFDGIVRDNTRGRKTLYLDYEAYDEMALQQMTELTAQAVEKFGVRGVTLVHRLGRLEVGETSVLIVVSSAHRGAAFEACRWVIDTLKRTVPIWKKEMFVDGAVWAAGEPFPVELITGAGESAL
jgi:MoaE-MoaD fusion protein